MIMTGLLLAIIVAIGLSSVITVMILRYLEEGEN